MKDTCIIFIFFSTIEVKQKIYSRSLNYFVYLMHSSVFRSFQSISTSHTIYKTILPTEFSFLVLFPLRPLPRDTRSNTFNTYTYALFRRPILSLQFAFSVTNIYIASRKSRRYSCHSRLFGLGYKIHLSRPSRGYIHVMAAEDTDPKRFMYQNRHASSKTVDCLRAAAVIFRYVPLIIRRLNIRDKIPAAVECLLCLQVRSGWERLYDRS